MRKVLYPILLSVLLSYQLFAQLPQLLLEGAADLAQVATLDDLAAYPLQLSPEEQRLPLLEKLGLLEPAAMKALADHLAQFGAMPTTYELMAVRGLPLASIRSILPYVSAVVPSSNALAEQGAFPGRIQLRLQKPLEQRAGFAIPDSLGGYRGSNFTALVSYRYEAFRWSANLMLQQDAGESFQIHFPRQLLFDHHSFYLNWKDPPAPFKQVIFGDYEMRLGQGVNFASGFSLGKGVSVGALHKSQSGPHPYRSLDEDRFLRGTALSIDLGVHTEVVSFFSHKRIDATLDRAEVENDSVAASGINLTASSGLHRTPGEIAKRNALGESLIGSGLIWQKANATLGAYASLLWYSSEISAGIKPYQQFNFSGKRLASGGIFASSQHGPCLFFGEWTISKHTLVDLAALQGILIAPAPKIDIGIVYRAYGKSYSAPFGNPIAEGSRPSNENGLLLVAVYRPNSKTALHFQADHFRFPWLRYRVDAPSGGSEYRLKWTHTPSKKQEYYFQWSFVSKARNLAGLPAVPYRSAGLKLHARMMLNAHFRWQNRFALSGFASLPTNGNANEPSTPRQTGWMAYTDLRFKKMGEPFSLATRLAAFQTADWDSRIYAFENNLQGAFSIPAFSGQGLRFYCLAAMRIRGSDSQLNIECKYSLTKWLDRDVVGSGNDQISKSARSVLELQLTLKH